MGSINQKSVTEIVYNRIRKDILSQKYSLGERLDINILSKKYGVSRTPIVHAISRLAQEGLVEVKPRRGSFVVNPTKRDVEEVTQVRIALETFVLEVAIPCLDEEHIRKIDQALKAAEKEGPAKDPEAFLSSDRIFHETIFELANNSKMFTLMNVIRSQIELFRVSSFSEEAARQSMERHRHIFEAMCEKNIEESKLLMRQHIEEVKEETLKILKKQNKLKKVKKYEEVF